MAVRLPEVLNTATCEHCSAPLVKRSGDVWTHAGGQGQACWTSLCCGAPAHHPIQMEACPECGDMRSGWSRQHFAWPIQSTIVIAEDPEDDEPAPSAEARRIGTKALVEIGCMVWSAVRQDSDGLGVGGVVVAIDHTGNDRIFHVIDPNRTSRLVVRQIAESELDDWSVEPPTLSSIARLARYLCRETARPLQDRSGGANVWTPADADRVLWAYRLSTVLMGGAG